MAPTPSGALRITPKAFHKEIIPVDKPNLDFQIVALGGSAGSLEGFEAFFQHLPSGTGMAYVVVPHLDPSQKGMMAEIIKRYTSMPVLEITDDMKVEPEHVYVVPSHKETALERDHFRLIDPEQPNGQRMPIDYFFQSLAVNRREHAIGAILSGMGADGTLGVKMIMENFGMVMVQDPGTARFDAMPRNAIKTEFVDYVLPVEEMPNKLVAYAQMPTLKSKTLIESHKSTQMVQKIFDLIRNKTGHDFSLYKRNTIFRRIERRMNSHQITQFSEYVQYLQDNPLEVEQLFKELLIGVTKFFRDAEAFALLEEKYLPQLLLHKEDGDYVRVRVAGCSTGEEAYSITILLQEAIEKSGKHLKVQVFATDIDPVAIEKARAACYQENITADVSPERLKRFFTQEDTQYTVKKDLREKVVFAVHNLNRDAPFTKLDLLTCRNLLIYLSAELQKKLFPVFHYALNPKGLLFLGSSETLSGFPDMFTTLDTKWKISLRDESDVPVTRLSEFPFTFTSFETVKPPSVPQVTTVKQEDNLSRVVQRVLLQQFAPPTLIINPKGDIFYVHGRTGKYLEPAQGQATLNVFEMAREGLTFELNNLVNRAAVLKEQTAGENIQIKTDHGTQYVKLTVTPLLEPDQVRGMLLLTFEDMPQPKPRKGRKDSAEEASQKDARIAELEKELLYTKQRLQSTIEEMNSSLEELKSTNEELQSANEELQSTNEETMTNKEEMQSLNEELMTINLQYQTKTEELVNSNNDMKNLLDSTEVATIFLDNNLNVRNFTPQATQIFSLIRADIGRSITHIASNLKYQSIQDDVKEVLDRLRSKEVHLQTKDEKQWYSMRVLPYRTADNFIDGAVVTFTNITSFKDLETSVAATSLYAANIIDIIQQPLVVLDGQLRVESTSNAFAQTFQLIPEQLKGQWLYHLGNGQWDIPQLRNLMNKVLKENIEIKNETLEHEFPVLGYRRMILNTRRVEQTENKPFKILLALEVFEK
ncbi:PAS domain-containing protein [Rufibacter sp. H-1]|uniref:protein-glutamate O-methyltransferase n=1 Tax=Rufibacter sediminis TaxID=2762756 RepID=A0ABR6VV08_9BACT|nr:CheR family methyltransferase [Rufibacter sediminis]MBC3541037.1 PAS domain-containing protein [Rufibacter sediminis]